MTQKLLPLSFALISALFFTDVSCPLASANTIYYRDSEVIANVRPKVIQKIRIKVNQCYEQPQRDFTSAVVCLPDRLYLYLSNGQVIQVDERQYNRNIVGKPIVR